MTDPHIRASDADREHVAEQLRRHYADGRLSSEELDERSDAVYAARTMADLAPPTAGLPAERPAPPPRSDRVRRRLRTGALPAVLVVLALAGAIALFTGGPSWLLWAAGGWLLFAGPWGKGRRGMHRHGRGRRRPHALVR